MVGREGLLLNTLHIQVRSGSKSGWRRIGYSNSSLSKWKFATKLAAVRSVLELHSLPITYLLSSTLSPSPLVTTPPHGHPLSTTISLLSVYLVGLYDCSFHGGNYIPTPSP